MALSHIRKVYTQKTKLWLVNNNNFYQPGIMVYTFNSSAQQRQRQVDLWEFVASMVYIANSRTARAAK